MQPSIQRSCIHSERMSIYLPADVEQRQYHLICTVADYQTFCTSPSACSVGDRVVIERLDYKFTLSVYAAETRVFSCALSRLTSPKSAELAAAPPLYSVPTKTTIQTVTAMIQEHRLRQNQTLVHVLTAVTPSRNVHRFVLTDIATANAPTNFVAIINDVAHNQRSEQWLVIPEASNMQNAIAQHMAARAQHETIRAAVASPKKKRALSPQHNVHSANDNTAMSASAMPQHETAAVVRPRAIVSLGITNLGNSCYMSAILQALFTLHSFVDDLCDEHLINAFTANASAGERQQSLYISLLELVVRMHRTADGHDGAVDISALKSVIGHRYARFAGFNQQDAHEFPQ